MDKTKAPRITPINGDSRRFISAGLGVLPRSEVSLAVQARILKKPKGCMSAPGFTIPLFNLDVQGHCISFFRLLKLRASSEDRPLRVAPLYFFAAAVT